MHKQTILQLNQLNAQFYQTVHQAFDQSRQQPWAGWKRLTAQFDDVSALKPFAVLDVGCGNGRFAAFLGSTLTQTNHTFVGIDANAELLKSASQSVFTHFTRVEWQQKDSVYSLLAGEPLLAQTQSARQFTHVCAFGLLHHLPSQALRIQFLKACVKMLAPDGLLIVSLWQFAQNQTLIRRAIDPSELNIDPNQLEPHDFFLDWQRGSHAIRYCHWVDEAEEQALIKESGATLLSTFAADGKTGSDNRYLILKR